MRLRKEEEERIDDRSFFSHERSIARTIEEPWPSNLQSTTTFDGSAEVHARVSKSFVRRSNAIFLFHLRNVTEWVPFSIIAAVPN